MGVSRIESPLKTKQLQLIGKAECLLATNRLELSLGERSLKGYDWTRKEKLVLKCCSRIVVEAYLEAWSIEM